MSRNGEPIMAMCNDTTIVCPIGMIATMDSDEIIIIDLFH